MRVIAILSTLFFLFADCKAQTTPEFITITAPNGKQYRAYASGPADSKIGVLLVHDFFGLSDAIKQPAESLGALGYRAVAVDLYNGKNPTTNEEATALMNAKDSAETDQILRAALSYLAAPGRKLACIGFSAGCVDAVRATLIQPGLFKATVVVYGGNYDKLPSSQLSRLKTPLLAITGSLDKWPFDAAIHFLSAYPDKIMELHVFSGADHGYAQPLFNNGKNYNAEVARKTWQLVETFLKQHLDDTTVAKGVYD